MKAYCVPTTPVFEMKFWLNKEIEHIEFVKALVPELPTGIKSELEKIKGQMEAIYDRINNCDPSSSELIEIIETVIYLANCYWALFLKIKKLVSSKPLIFKLILHIIEETRYFLRIMNYFHTEFN